jgi:chlorite dismutase
LYAFTDAYWSLNKEEKSSFHNNWLASLRSAARTVDVFQNTDSKADMLVWCALEADDPCNTSVFFEKLAQANAPYRPLIRPVDSLWGFTRPSQYTKTRSAQEIDPFAETRMRYLVMYPFAKTAEWYLMSRESRQGMMNEHIRIGKQYEDIKQLLLYSFGLQDQEFVVVYETEDLPPSLTLSTNCAIPKPAVTHCAIPRSTPPSITPPRRLYPYGSKPAFFASLQS